jgi:hypothetical protein
MITTIMPPQINRPDGFSADAAAAEQAAGSVPDADVALRAVAYRVRLRAVGQRAASCVLEALTAYGNALYPPQAPGDPPLEGYVPPFPPVV